MTRHLAKYPVHQLPKFASREFISRARTPAARQQKRERIRLAKLLFAKTQLSCHTSSVISRALLPTPALIISTWLHGIILRGNSSRK